MDLTLDQALQKGVEAHKAGKVQEADRYYTAILKANPKHPDANHNMGVLAVGVGKVDQALPFFKTALEANPKIAQFWLSYVDALIKLNRMDDAKSIFDKAKSHGAKGDGFDKLEQKFEQTVQTDNSGGAQDGFSEAVEFRESGQYTEAIEVLKSYIGRFPKDPNLLALLAHCHILKDDIDAATMALSKAKEIDPNLMIVGWNEVRLLLKKQNVFEALSIAKALHKKFPDDVEGMGVLGSCLRANGDLNESLEVLNQAILREPNYAEAYINRGLIWLSQEDKSEAASDFEKAYQIKPYIKQIWDLIIQYKVEQEQYKEAISLLINMIEIDPGHKKSFALLAVCSQKANDIALAIMSFKKVLEVVPNDAFTHVNLGIALRMQGETEEAVANFTKALSIKTDYPEAYFNMGVTLKDQGKLDEAIKAYGKAISIKPDYVDAYNNMGNALSEQGKHKEAIVALKAALSIKPEFVEACNNMANALKEQGSFEEAIGFYNKALSIKPDYPEAFNNMGLAFQEQDKVEEAIGSYNKALSIKPDYAEAYNNMGVAYQDQGKFREAMEAYKKAISTNPTYAEAYYNFSCVNTNTKSDDHFKQVKILYENKDLNDVSRCALNFALAKMYEDVGEVSKAFTHLSEGNAISKTLLNYSFDQDANLFSSFKKAQPYILRHSLGHTKHYNGVTPIFILGMPRSGTTLVEQIISSHSNVMGAGEIKYVSQYGKTIATGAQKLNEMTIAEFREKCLYDLDKLSHGNPFITDKMPQNFYFIPLICAAFPEAKIVHVQRDAAATCWSNYKQYFSKNGMGYSYDLKDVVSYFLLYKDLMKVWQAEYGDRIYNLHYEELVNDQEKQTRKLIKYLELNWEKACLSPQENKRIVRTASQQQVRQSVYKGSSEAWRKYEPFLDGAFSGLQSL